MNKELISSWLKWATNELSAVGIESARLDAEIILTHTLKKPRTYLHAHGDEELDMRLQEIANARLDLRLTRVPVAYIIGHKEFYGRRFKVTTATLIPRPETEVMIDLLKEKMPTNLSLLSETCRVVDVGTGSGAIGITAKLELPELEVTLLDNSPHALTVAKKNAELLNADVDTIRSDLLAMYPFSPDIILANLPYVDAEWEVSPETHHEPAEALYAAKQGLDLINKLIAQAAAQLVARGYLFLEADERQHARIIQTAKAHGFALAVSRGLILCLQKN